MILGRSADNHPRYVTLGGYREQTLPSEVMRSGVGSKGREQVVGRHRWQLAFGGNTLRQKAGSYR